VTIRLSYGIELTEIGPLRMRAPMD